MKDQKGQIATEFVLVLPLICGAFLGLLLMIMVCARAQLATYAGFMGSRVYGVWPENVDGEPAREKSLENELSGVLQGAELSYDVDGNTLIIQSVKLAPYLMNTLSIWGFETRTPIVVEPMTTCEGEDNKIGYAEVQPCP